MKNIRCKSPFERLGSDSISLIISRMNFCNGHVYLDMISQMRSTILQSFSVSSVAFEQKQYPMQDDKTSKTSKSNVKKTNLQSINTFVD